MILALLDNVRTTSYKLAVAGGSFFEMGYRFRKNDWGFYSYTILDSKPIGAAVREGLISTAFSAKLHGLDHLTGNGLSSTEIGQGMYHLGYRSGQLGYTINNQ